MATELCIAKPRRRPSETGLDVAELEKFVGVLPSRESARSRLREFVEEARVSENPLVALIVAEWGEGKTSLFYSVLNRLEPPRAAAFIVSGRTVVTFLEKVCRGEVAPKTVSVAYGFLASVLAALLAEQLDAVERKCGSRPEPLDLSNFERCEDFVPRALEALANACSCEKMLLFIDEFEDIVGSDPRVVEYTVSGVTHLLNGAVKEISSREDVGKGRFAGWLHLLISLTPSAYNKLRSFGELSTVIARMSRRVKLIELKPLSREESWRLLKGLCTYVFDGVPIEKVFELPSMVNPLVVSTLGNPAALQRAFTELVYMRASDCGECFEPIDVESEVRYLQRIVVDLAGAKLPLIVSSFLEKLEKAVEGIAKLSGEPSSSLTKLLHAFLTNIVLDRGSIERIAGVRGKEVDDLLHLLNVAARTPLLSPYSVSRIAYPAIGLELSDEAKHVIAEAWRRALAKCPSIAGDPSELAQLVLEQTTFVSPSGELVAVVPVEEGGVELVSELIPVQISRDEAAVVLRTLSNELGNAGSTRELFALSPRIVNSVYLSPELTFLNFVRGAERRFRYWRELLSATRDEYLALGIIAALSIQRSSLEVLDVEVL